MKLPNFSVSWVDFVTAIVLLIGIMRGRKRGLSEELLDTIQWVLIIVAGAFLYKKLGDLMNQKPVLSQLSYYILSYIIIALAIKTVFSTIKRHFGQKLIESDIFGRGEFYLGMMAGTVRWACIYLFFLSLFHAPAYSAEYRAAKAKQDSYNYGDITFPSVMSIQDEIYKNSFTGKYTEKYLVTMLMSPASSESQHLRDDNSMAKRREREIDALMGGK